MKNYIIKSVKYGLFLTLLITSIAQAQRVVLVNSAPGLVPFAFPWAPYFFAPAPNYYPPYIQPYYYYPNLHYFDYWRRSFRPFGYDTPGFYDGHSRQPGYRH